MKRDYIKYFVGLAACSFLGLTSCDDDKDLGGQDGRNDYHIHHYSERNSI